MKTSLTIAVLLSPVALFAQQTLETGGKKMPDEWIDKDTHHRVVKLTRIEGSNYSFYFHNNPFVGNKMIFYNSAPQKADEQAAKVEISNINSNRKQIYWVDLKTLKTEQLSNHPTAMNGEIVSAKTGKVFFQVKDSVFSVDLKTKKETLEYVFPADFKASITCVNADGTLLGGAKSSDEEKELFKKYPNKSSYFNIIYEAKLPRTLFTVNLKTRQLDKLHTDTAWLNHVQFSAADPDLMMFCHEGPWHKVNRIWTINVKTKKITQVHKRIMDMEIAGHEWSSADGSIIWYDLQQPRSVTFFVEGHNVKTGEKTKYELQRDEWSIHYNSTKDNKLFCGDGGDPGQVAKAKDGMWIYLFTPQGNKFVSEKLVNMKNHKYSLEPNVHFSPDENWVIFRANFEGETNVYAVEIKKSDMAKGF
ncbi:MAG TPA: oligogalacturonate lyase family protein [Chitinophagaceae bacterium]